MSEKQRLQAVISDLYRQRDALDSARADVNARLDEAKTRFAALCRREAGLDRVVDERTAGDAT